MTAETFRLRADDGVEIAARRWLPEDAPRAVVRISHGMAEHCARYARLAEELTRHGIAVYAHDHRGHGETAKVERDEGHFADEDGWARVIADLRMVGDHARREHPGARHCLFGHSMGSFMTQWVMLFHPDEASAYVLSGSNAGGGALVTAGKQAAKLERLRMGKRGKSALLTALSFGSFNRGFEGRTQYDWLSRDPIEVDKYVADPKCGFMVTTQLWVELLEALETLGKTSWARVAPETPVLVFSGDRDPVSAGGGIEKLLRAMERGGMRRVTSKLYKDGRHEMVNESNRDEVFADLTRWLREHLPSA